MSPFLTKKKNPLPYEGGLYKHRTHSHKIDVLHSLYTKELCLLHINYYT